MKETGGTQFDASLNIKMPQGMRNQLEVLANARLLKSGDIAREAILEYLAKRGGFEVAKQN